jgi:hypothetical protein
VAADYDRFRPAGEWVVKRGGRESLPLAGTGGAGQSSARLVKRHEVRAAASADGQTRSRQPVTGSLELPVPTALVRQAAHRDTAGGPGPPVDGMPGRDGGGGREADLATWERLTPAQRRQPKWRVRASEWQRAAAAKAELVAALAGHDRPPKVSFSLDQARRLLGSAPDAAAPLIGALRSREVPVMTGLFVARTDDAETPK